MMNEALYYALEEKFGPPGIIKQGETYCLDSSKLPEILYGSERNKYIFNGHLADRGETYAVDCPFCGDTRQRLWIPAVSGMEVDLEGRTFRFHCLAKCYNETNCMKVAENRRLLWDLIRGLPSELAPREAAAAREVRAELRTDAPEHVLLNSPDVYGGAREYLIARNYDPDFLAEKFQIGVCRHWFYSRPSLYIPFRMYGELVHWQCRKIDEVVGGRLVEYTDLYVGGKRDGKKKGKYYNPGSSSKSAVLYNFDGALRSRSRTIKVAEGVPDVWRLGQDAVGKLGTKMSPTQKKLLIEGFRDRKLIIYPDMNDKTGQGYDDAVAEAAGLAGVFAGGVWLSVPPAGKDPGGCTPEMLEQADLSAVRYG